MTAPVSFIAGLVIGALVGGTGVYLIAPSSSDQTTASSLKQPTQEEANAAFLKLKGKGWSLKLGTCEKNTGAPGVICTVDYTNALINKTRQGTVGFSETPSGWMAVHYF